MRRASRRERIGKPWLAPVAEAVATAAISLEAAEAIRVGLGEPSENITELTLTDAAARLVEAAAELNVDQLAIRARTLRDDLDEAGIAEREAERKQRRSLRVFRQSDGMTRLVWLLDPESAVIVTETYDQLTAPRRGGPRMVEETEKIPSRRDHRRHPHAPSKSPTTASSNCSQIGGAAAPNTLIGTHRPAVRVLVNEETLRDGTGHGRARGATRRPSPSKRSNATSATPASCPSSSTVTGNASTSAANNDCSPAARKSPSSPETADASGPDAIGRRPGPKRTTSTSGSETAERPTSSTACSSADTTTCCSTTTTGRSEEADTDYWLIPPRAQDRDQTPIPLPSKSAALNDLLRQRERQTG